MIDELKIQKKNSKILFIIEWKLFFFSSSENVNQSSNAQHSGAIYASRTLSALIPTVNSLRKRKLEELDIEDVSTIATQLQKRKKKKYINKVCWIRHWNSW